MWNILIKYRSIWNFNIPTPSAPLGNLLKDVLFKFPSPWARIVFKCLNPSASFNFIDGHSFCKGKSSDQDSLLIGQQLSGHFCFNSPPQPGKGSFFTPLTTDNNQMPLGYWRGEFVASNWSAPNSVLALEIKVLLSVEPSSIWTLLSWI